jgi:cell division septation protein DedD
VASYVERKPADDLVLKLKDSGFDAYVSQPAATNGRFRVRIRPAAGESAGELASRLSGFGFDTWATSE